MDNQTTVMIADNAEEFCAGLTAALQRTEGFRVVGTANDGEQAVRMIGEKQPQILVLDMMLAKRDGISVLKTISTMERRPVVLATSGFITEYVAQAAANLGVQYLMLKPTADLFLVAFARKSCGCTDRHVDDVNLQNNAVLESRKDPGGTRRVLDIREDLHDSELCVGSNTGDDVVLTRNNARDVRAVVTVNGENVRVAVSVVESVGDLCADVNV